MEPQFEYQRATLERIEIGLLEVLDPLLLEPTLRFEVRGRLDKLKKRVEMHVRGFLLAEKNLQTAEVVYPADWWQAFKQRWLPRRWLRRWPVRCCVVRLDLEAIYRDFRPSVPTRDLYLHVIKRSLPEQNIASFVRADPGAPIEVTERTGP